MLTDVLLEHAALVPAALVLVVAVCVAVGFAVLSAHREKLLWPLVALSASPAVALTLLPTAAHTHQRCAVQFFLPELGSVELLANVALLFPLCFFATLASRRPLATLAAGAALSASIEAIQAFVPAIGRSCDTSDWAMNCTGVVVAVGLASATSRAAGR